MSGRETVDSLTFTPMTWVRRFKDDATYRQHNQLLTEEWVNMRGGHTGDERAQEILKILKEIIARQGCNLRDIVKARRPDLRL